MNKMYLSLLGLSIGVNAWLLSRPDEVSSQSNLLSSESRRAENQLNHSSDEAEKQDPSSFHSENELSDNHDDKIERNRLTKKFNQPATVDVTLEEANGHIDLWLSSEAKKFIRENPTFEYMDLYDHLASLSLEALEKKTLSPENLIQSLYSSQDADISNALSLALSELVEVPSIKNEINHHLSGDSNPEIEKTLEVLSKAPLLPEDTIGLLLQNLKKNKDPKIMNEIVSVLPSDQALGESLSKEMVAELVQLIKENRDTEIHLNALEPLTFYSQSGKDQDLIFSSLSSSNAVIRGRAAFCIGSLASKLSMIPSSYAEAKEALFKVLTDSKEDLEVRKMALLALKRFSLTAIEKEKIKKMGITTSLQSPRTGKREFIS